MRTLGFVCVLFATACSSDMGNGGGQNPGSDDNITPVCGDGVCDASEVHSCAMDCGNPPAPAQPVCGNNVCDPGEDSTNCPGDCPAGSGSNPGSGSGSGSACGTSDCSDPNTLLGCILGTCTDTTLCNMCLGGLGGGSDDSGCDGGAPDGTCSTTEQADPTTCTTDCPCNFDGTCDPGEMAAWCTDCP